ncbi:hypothetical protein [Deinococcus altitudinis]|uniref:hypothetical protein n=1 Tax=Deinococcus altitudinis TaxID=468914 RepID=UPI0038922182
MADNAEDLRNLLRSATYTMIKPWSDGLEFAGEGYLEQLNEHQLTQIKDVLDIVISTGSEEILKSHYEDEIYP